MELYITKYCQRISFFILGIKNCISINKNKYNVFNCNGNFIYIILCLKYTFILINISIRKERKLGR